MFETCEMIITYLLVVSNPVVNNELVEPCKGKCSETEINGSIILTRFLIYLWATVQGCEAINCSCAGLGSDHAIC
jgi:hypothetical protein